MLQSDSFAQRVAFLGGEAMISQDRIVLHLPLDERRVRVKFDYTGSDGVEMHKEQTNEQTFFFIHIDH